MQTSVKILKYYTDLLLQSLFGRVEVGGGGTFIRSDVRCCLLHSKHHSLVCFLYGLQKVRENEGELDKHKQLSQRKEEEVNNLNSQLETKRSEADQQQQELSRLKQDNVSTVAPGYNEYSGSRL